MPHGNKGRKRGGQKGYAVYANRNETPYPVSAWVPCAARLRGMLAERKIQQKLLAPRIGITQAYLSMMLNPDASGRVPSLAFIMKMARILNVEPALLIPDAAALKNIYPESNYPEYPKGT